MTSNADPVIDLSDLIAREQSELKIVRTNLKKNVPQTIPYAMCGLTPPNIDFKSAEIARVMATIIEPYPSIPAEVIEDLALMYQNPTMARMMVQHQCQYIHTPFALCEEIIGDIFTHNPTPELLQVVSAVEMVIVLVYVKKFPVEKIIFLDDAIDMQREDGKMKTLKGGFLKKFMNFPVANIRNFNRAEDTMHQMITDIVGNPPYEFPNSVNDDEKLWHVFVEKMVTEMPQGGTLSFVVPVSMMTGPGPEKKFRPMFEKHGVRDVLNAKVHEKKMFDAGVDTCHWTIRKSNELNNLDDLFIGGNVFGPLNKSILNKVVNPDAGSRFKISDGGYQLLNGKRVLIEKSQYLLTQPDGPFEMMYVGNGQMVYVQTNGTLISRDKWKVVVPRSKAPNKQTMFILAPGYGCDNLHGFIQFETEQQAKDALSVFTSDLIIYCANTYKMSHGKYGSGYKSLFHQTDLIVNPGSGEWTDEKIFDFYGITEEEKLEISTRMKKNK